MSDLVLPDDGKTQPLVAYAEGGDAVRLLIPIKYCYTNAKAHRIVRHVYDEMQDPDLRTQPEAGQAQLDVELDFIDGVTLQANFTMPKNPASLQVYYTVRYSTPRWGPREYSRYVDIELVPTAQTFEEFVQTIR